MLKLSEDMIIEVLSYLDINDVIKLDLSFDCFKKYLVLRLKNKKHNSYKNIWYKGVYNNQYNKCFKCERYLLNDLHAKRQELDKHHIDNFTPEEIARKKREETQKKMLHTTV